MPWHGLEWVIPLYEIAMLALPVYCFATLRRRVVQHAFPKYRALRRYIVTVILPVVLYTLFFVGLSGFEQLTQATLVPAEIARSFFILVGVGIAVWLLASIIFAIALIFVPTPPASLDVRPRRPPD